MLVDKQIVGPSDDIIHISLKHERAKFYVQEMDKMIFHIKYFIQHTSTKIA